MSAQIFIMLLNPGIGALLAAAFFLLWLNQRDKTYVLYAAVGYAISATAFFVQDVAFRYIGSPLPMNAERVVSNLGFLLCGCCLCLAVLGRFSLRPPVLFLTAVTTAAMGGLLWYLFIEPSIAGRVFSVSSALGLIAALMAVKLWRVERKHLADRFLFWISAISAVNYLLRPVLILWASGDFGPNETFQSSLYWTTVQFSQPLISIAFALNLMVAIAIDLIGQLQREARTDKLSGLLNRRGFEDAAEALMKARGHSASPPVCLIIADLDHFKQINDTFGHSVGDAVIGLFGRHIASMATGEMIAGRIGGEEFAILLPGHEIQAARLFAESLRACPWDYWSGMLPDNLAASVSIGVSAAWPGADLYGLMNHADEALYDAKKAGRDQVRIYGASVDFPATLARLRR
ncbi:GGDEF domain-containing protein [Hyphomonas sp. WL0036]|uniref:GGDEF domain-containing protein n=1 Tax=Hyphomonas sediminis TaxID=2866160 RepID=UPI001C7E7B02|nr:GGDEF domain-containing protein [Hyphomonas sediminis]MBY9068252.1 GGDEF domain-containing protein [Hyphomonas sediminis]